MVFTDLRLHPVRAIGALVFLGPMVAALLNLTNMMAMRVTRNGRLSGELTLRLTFLNALLAAAGYLLGVAFFGNLPADALSCSAGNQSAC